MAALDLGMFLPWIEAEFEMGEHTAQRFMDAAEAFGGKSDTVSDFSASVLYALAATSNPAVVRLDELRFYDDPTAGT